MSDSPTIGLVAPLAEELAGLEARLVVEGRESFGDLEIRTASLSGRRLVVAVTGDGAREARAGLERLLERHPVERLICMGIAGGLSPQLGRGDVVVADRVVDERGMELPAPDLVWLARCEERHLATPGTVVSASRVLWRARDKADLWRRLGEPGLACVDLESAAYAGVANAAGVPYLVLRALSDSVDESLPLDFNRFLDERGRISRKRVALRAALRPGLARALRALQQNVRLASESLADAVERLLESE